MHRAENQAHSECGWKPGDEGVGMDSSRSEPDKWRTKNRKERGRHCLLSKHLAARPPVQAALRLASLGLDGTRPTLQTRSLEEAMPAISCQRVRLRPAWEQKTLDRIGLLMEAATKGSGLAPKKPPCAEESQSDPQQERCAGFVDHGYRYIIHKVGVRIRVVTKKF